jgi:hypothetical protein
MGSFYVNATAKGRTQSQVHSFLAQMRRKAFVFPTINGFTTFCDAEAETQEPKAIDELGRKASVALQCPIFCVLNHDDDILWYALYEDGEISDEYDSFPTYFEGIFSPPKGGNAAKLCNLAGSMDKQAELSEILRRPHGSDGYVLESERHADIATAIGLPSFSIGFGYRYLERSELPEGLDQTDLLRC